MSAQQTETWVGIVEDTLDAVMVLGSGLYIYAINDTSLQLSRETMAWIGTSAGALRLFLRRIAKRVVEARLGAKK